MKRFFLLELILLVKLSQQFVCEHDGIYEDTSNCHMYYECSWIGTVLEKIDHIECPENSYFCTKYQRCEDINEFEYRLAAFSDEIDKEELTRYEMCLINSSFVKSTTTISTTTTSTSTTTSTTTRKTTTEGSSTTTKQFESYKVAPVEIVQNNLSTSINEVGLIFLTKDQNIIVQSSDRLKEKLLDLIPSNITIETPNKNQSNSIDMVLNRKKLKATFKTLKDKYSRARVPHLYDFFGGGYATKEQDRLVSEVKLEKSQQLRKRRILTDDVSPKPSAHNSTITPTRVIAKKKLNFVKALRKIDDKFTEIMLTRKQKLSNIFSSNSTTTTTPLPKNFTILGTKSFSAIELDEKNGNNIKAYKSGNLSYIVPLNKTKLFGNAKKSEPYILLEKNQTQYYPVGRNGKEFNTFYMQPPTDALIECKDNDFGLECSCSVSLSPPRCKQLINAFLSSCRVLGCKNNGRCINMRQKYPIPYICACPRPFYGTFCELSFTDSLPIVKASSFKEPLCQPNPCLNSGKCEIVVDSVQCKCGAYYTGKYCESPMLACPNDCSDHGNCIITANSVPKCRCNREWLGVDCSEANYCLYNDCMNNSTCSNDAYSKGYSCMCAKGYTGKRCEVLLSKNTVVPYNYPNGNPCGSVKCLNNGTCVLSFSHAKNKFSFVCKCPLGFSGSLCEIEQNACESSPCRQPGAQCVLIDNYRYKCMCGLYDCPPPGFTKFGNLMALNYTQSKQDPCRSDLEICKKYPQGNDTYMCVKPSLGQEATCLSTALINCEMENPCLNGGKCLPNYGTHNWKCVCESDKYTGRLCETELCSKVYRSLANHTMCLPNSINFKSGEVNYTQINLILKVHNEARRKVSPPAVNMQKMYWDNDLQHLAQKRAQMCTFDSNKTLFKKQNNAFGMVIGENVAAGLYDWSEALSSWTNESKYFSFNNSLSGNLKAGHYTQMIYSTASKIGCGYAECENSRFDKVYVCFYGEIQTYHSRYEPYSAGDTCAACSNNCNNGLCDCRGVYCANGGSINLNTCECSCLSPTFNGKYCEKVKCPKEDSPFCSQNLFKDKCWLYPLVRANCPHMCGLCSKDSETL